MKDSVFTLVPNNGKNRDAQILKNASQLEARYKSKYKDELSSKYERILIPMSFNTFPIHGLLK